MVSRVNPYLPIDVAVCFMSMSFLPGASGHPLTRSKGEQNFTATDMGICMVVINARECNF
jgi:hypothetical protein